MQHKNVTIWSLCLTLTTLIVIVSATLFTAADPAQAQAGVTCQVIQPNATVGKDAYIKEDKKDERRGGDPELRVKTEAGKLNRAFLQFDLSSIPAGMTLSSATLSLYVKDAAGGPVTINVHRVTAAWNEAQATWKARDKAAALLWAAPGGDFDPTVAASASVDNTKNVWRSWNVTSLAQGWLNNPASNLGLILESPVTNPKTEKKFKSSDDGAASQRPKLEVCFSGPVTVDADHIADAINGQTKTYAHTVRVGALTTAVNLSATSSQGWAARIFKDVDGDGVRDAEDTQISATPAMGPDAAYPILVELDVPFNAPFGAVDVTTITASAQSGGASDTAINRTRVGRMIDLQPDFSQNATPGSVVFFGHRLSNNSANQDCIAVTAASNQGWSVLLWDDLNGNGVRETSSPAEPALSSPVCLAPGATKHLVAEVQVAAGASAGVVDQTVLKAVSGNEPWQSDTAVDTTRVFVDVAPSVDGRYDSIYSLSTNATEVCYTVNGVLFGKLATYYQPGSDGVYVALAIDKDFVDNSYGVNQIGWPSGHTFANLLGSDQAEFEAYDANDVKVLDFNVDYIGTKSGTPSGYGSWGVGAGSNADGGMNTGSASRILAWGTSLEYNLNGTGYCTGGNCNGAGTDLKVNSPATDAFYTPNATYPNWIFDVIYEVKIDPAAFGATGFGYMDIPYIHASPSKLGTNTIVPEPGVCPAEIGDRVWNDLDGDAVQDAGESGISGVQLRLYRDNGDRYFDAATDALVRTQTTTVNGRYLFSDLEPNDYFVDVIDNTVSMGLRTTTFNDPTSAIGLFEGQQYWDADFGYVLGAPIGDAVWLDINRNGVQDAGEPGVGGVAVRLYDGANTLVGSTFTSAGGFYSFPNRPAGAYQVEFVLPDGYRFTTGNQGGNALTDSDADPATGRSAVFTTSAGVADLSRDAGLIAFGGIGDFVWYDADGDGVQDVGEPGIGNVTLDLYRGGVKVATTTTGADGGYLFGGLGAGNYVVDVTDQYGVLAGLSKVTANQSQPDPSGFISLANGELYKDADFGYRLVSTGNAILGDTVWYDANGDGMQQPGEAGAPGVQVCAGPVGGGAVNCATTDSNGRYLMAVAPGSYTVGPINPPGGTSATTPTSYVITVAANEQFLNADFGYDSPQLSAIGNLIFRDGAANGVYDGGDAPLAGVSVDLIRDGNNNGVWDSGEPIVATTTSASVLDGDGGNYLFLGVPNGAYLVHVSDTNGVLSDNFKSPLGSANINNHNQRDPYAVTVTGGANLTADFGYYASGRANSGVIGNQVWIERDGNGVFDALASDVGQAGVTVEIYKDGASYAKTTTGAGGDYAFVGLPSGVYSLTVADDFGVLAGFQPTALGTNQTQDNHNKTQPYTITLAQGGFNLAADFGYIQPGAIGDYVWYDSDGDGVQDLFEPGIANVTLDLIHNGVVVASTSTGADGGYIFTNLSPGNYQVDVTDINGVLAGLTHTTGPQSHPDPSNPISLASGQTYADADFGYVRQFSGAAVIGDLVWYDGDGDGQRDPGEPGISSVQVCAVPPSGLALCSTTDAAGFYRILVGAGVYTITVPTPPVGLTPTTLEWFGPVVVHAGTQYLDADFGFTGPSLGSISGTVWRDNNRNGLLEAGEMRFPGVSVDVIRDSNGNGTREVGEPVLATAVTDISGGYRFDGLPAGAYLVQVSDTTNVLDDYVVSALGASPGQDDNNQEQPYAITLAAGEDNSTADFGYVAAARNLPAGIIGNQVWYEADGNGYYQPHIGEIGVAGVTVALYRNGLPYAATTTGAGGDYAFTGLPAGTYSVRVTDLFGVLSGVIRTTPGPFPNQDNSNQTLPYTVTLASNAIDMTADFGYTRPGAIGDLVWYDSDGDGIQDVGEPGIGNVTLALYRNNALVATTVSGADGGYLFAGLQPGIYKVDVTDANGMLAGMTQVIANQAQTDPSMDISLGAGQLFKDADFGYRLAPGAGNALLGDRVWYDANGNGLQEPGEPGIPMVAVCTSPQNGAIPPLCALTDVNGVYRIPTPAGGYVVGVQAPGGLTPTTPLQVTTTVANGEQYLDADFGFTSAALGSIGNLVFLDSNRDGIFQGETALAGVSVDLIKDTDADGLWDAGEPIIATTKSGGALDGANGNYLFRGVPAGAYLVNVSDTNAVLTDYIASPNDPANQDGRSKARPYALTLPAGGGEVRADFGYYPADRPNVGVIGNQVWIETAADGVFAPSAGDVGQHGVTVELYLNGLYYDKTTTGPGGDYSFVGLPAGNYTVFVGDDYGVLTGYQATTPGAQQAQDNHSKVQPYNLSIASGGYNLTADFGYVPLGAIGDTIYYDDDRSGSQNGEQGIPNVVVRLYTNGAAACDTLVDTVVTDANGRYLFRNLTAGSYCVVVPESAAENPFLSGMERTGGTTLHTVNLGPSEHYLLADFGYAGFGAIRGIVFFDIDRDGVQDLNEPGIPNTQICIFADINGDGQPDTNTPLACTTTDQDGAYSFNNRTPGSYPLQETDPAGMSSTTPNLILAQLVVSQGTGLSENNNFGNTVNPDYTIAKQLMSPSPVRPGQIVQFRITVVNNGQGWITQLPLRDNYQTPYLAFQSASPATNDGVNDGQLDWSDLTASFNRDLAPGESFEVTVNFIALADTSAAPNSQTVNTATALGGPVDPDGPGGALGAVLSVGTKSANAPAQIFAPTSALVSSAETQLRDGRVVIRWTTVSEAELLGFHVLRSVDGAEFVQINAEMIQARNAGAGQGVDYEFVDESVDMTATNLYQVQLLLSDGRSEPVDAPWQVEVEKRMFLPVIVR